MGTENIRIVRLHDFRLLLQSDVKFKNWSNNIKQIDKIGMN